MAFAWAFLSRISVSQITGTIGANHLSTECVSKTEIANICIKANAFKKKNQNEQIAKQNYWVDSLEEKKKAQI